MIFPKKIKGRRLFFIFIVSLSLLFPSSFLFAQEPTLKVAFTQPQTLEAEAPEAWIQLEWASQGIPPESIHYELHSCQSLDFSSSTLRYRGKDTASLISGLNPGDYFFEVRLMNQDNTLLTQTSQPLKVTVKFIDFKIVITLLSLGLFVFALTVFTILFGHRNNRQSTGS